MLRMGQRCFLKGGLIGTFSNFLLLLKIELVVCSEKLAVIEGEARSSGKHCKEILRKKRKITVFVFLMKCFLREMWLLSLNSYELIW